MGDCWFPTCARSVLSSRRRRLPPVPTVPLAQYVRARIHHPAFEKGNPMTRKPLYILAMFLLSALMPPYAAGQTERCAAQRASEVGRFVRCYERAAGRALLDGTQPDFSTCLTRLQTKWGKIEARFGSMCPATPLLSEIEVVAENSATLLFSVSTASAPPPGCGNGVREGSEQCDTYPKRLGWLPS